MVSEVRSVKSHSARLVFLTHMQDRVIHDPLSANLLVGKCFHTVYHLFFRFACKRIKNQAKERLFVFACVFSF